MYEVSDYRIRLTIGSHWAIFGKTIIQLPHQKYNNLYYTCESCLAVRSDKTYRQAIRVSNDDDEVWGVSWYSESVDSVWGGRG